jgi:hypothetical protein
MSGHLQAGLPVDSCTPRCRMCTKSIHFGSDVLRPLTVLHLFLAFDHRRRHGSSFCYKSWATRVVSAMKAAQGAMLRVPSHEHWQIMLLC